MTSLNSVLLTGLSAIRASQAGLGVASQNIANANTPGYVRTELTLAPRTQQGPGAGVEVTSIRRAADRFLATAAYISNATYGSANVRADLLARAQSSFGDPNSDTTMFATLDQFWSAMTEIGVDPASTLRRDEAVSALQSTYSETRRVGESIQSLIAEADQRISDTVSQAQSLMNRIAALNKEIQLTKRSGAESSAAENAQSAMIDELSELMDVRVSPLIEGGVHVRTSGGALLVGVNAATLSYSPNSAPFATHGVITFNEDLGTQSNIEPFLLSGQLKGLLDARDKDLAGLAEALGGFSGALADALNQVHNENASAPAVDEMIGRQTGLLATDQHNFTGRTTIGVVDSGGNLRQRLTIDFTAGTITGEDPAATYNFGGSTIANMVAALDAALGAANPAGNASFTDGVLSLDVGSSGGIVIQQPTTGASDRAGRGFSHFFGLNDLVSRPTPLFFENGVEGGDLHGFQAGGALTYQVTDAAGRNIATRTISIAGALTGAASDWDDLIAALNANGTGVGEFGAFALDANTGRLAFTANPAFKVALVSDTTERGDTGVSMTALHGMSKASTAGRAIEVDVDPQITDDPSRLAVGRPNLGATIGTRIIELGDNRGSSALAAARDSIRDFPAAGSLSPQATSLAVYAARLGGEAGRIASDSKRAAEGAEAVATAAADRRAQVEGVNLDDELMRMTTYQNSYAAAARVIQAAQDMLDILMSIGYR
ncbi:flagellar hook-associated protein FlgK [alpha proteobacterium U9-1i]|nr:flagellar hook-associated protein FlgK [alpha proteobacterium U9-1i]